MWSHPWKKSKIPLQTRITRTVEILTIRKFYGNNSDSEIFQIEQATLVFIVAEIPVRQNDGNHPFMLGG